MTRFYTKTIIKNPKRLLTLALSPATLACHGDLLADVTSVFNANSASQVTIEYRDDNHVRMNAANGSYLIITGGQGYVAAQQGNTWAVFAFRDMATMISQLGAGLGAIEFGGDEFSILDMNETTEVNRTSRRETVAGIPGDVYQFTTTDSSGYRDVSELVMSNHPDALDAYRGLMRISTMMGELVGIQGFDTLMDDRYGLADQAVLRADGEWVLSSLSRANIPDSSFVLPASPTNLSALSGLSGAQTLGASVTSMVGNWLGDEVSNAGQVAGDEAATVIEETVQDARSTVSDGIRQGVRRGLRSLLE